METFSQWKFPLFRSLWLVSSRKVKKERKKKGKKERRERRKEKRKKSEFLKVWKECISVNFSVCISSPMVLESMKFDGHPFKGCCFTFAIGDILNQF